MADDDLFIELLGPVRVRRDGEVLDVTGPKQLAVLAVLALSPGGVTDPAVLAAALWGEDAPPSAGGTLRAYVSRLRSLLPDGVVQRSTAGWSLHVDRGSVDVLRAQDLLAAATGAPAGAERELVEQALALWRGRPLHGLHSVPFARTEVARLEELEAAARERLLELRLAEGQARELVIDAADLVARFPHRERAVTCLALALSRSGRYAEALAAVDGLRRRLADDLGLDPSAAVVDLQRRLLVHDPTVAPVVSVPTRPAPDPGRAGPLPLPLTSFIGRDADIAQVHAALGAARLVTLVGPGGAGKTRLALEALRRLDVTGLDGPWLVELAHVPLGGGVPDSVAGALEIASPVEPTPRLIAEAVRGRRMLLVLDNCEHVVAEVAELVQCLLSRCAGLQVLATSREPLGVPGERALAVTPMTLGAPGDPGEAERLFTERAAGVVPGFRLDAVTAPLVSRLVRALDGLPLAVELAAARLALLSLEDLVGMLDDRFTVLAGGSRTVLPQQRTLEAAVRWSYDLLDPQEQLLFRISSAFHGPFHLAALRSVGQAELDRPVVGLLASLVAKSMVQVDRVGDVSRTRTYRLLETMRAFGREQLDAGLDQRCRQRHAAWFASEADQAHLGLRGPDARTWLVHLDTVRPDTRAALQHAVDTGDRPLALRLVAGLSTHWFHRGHVQEGRHWTAAALRLTGSADDVLETRAALGGALLAYVAGEAARSSEDGGALWALQGALARAPGADDDTMALALVYAGYFQAAFGALAEALAHFEAADVLLRTGRLQPWAVSEVLFAQGQLLRAQGRRPDALRVLATSAQTAEACGHRWARGSARWIAAKVHLDLRQGAAALTELARELPSCLDLGIHTSTLTLLHTAAAAAATVEQHAEGARLLGTVDAWSERLGYSPAAMDPQDAAAHRALVGEGLTRADAERRATLGRHDSLPEAVRRVVALAGLAAPAPAPRRAAPTLPGARPSSGPMSRHSAHRR